jgi:DNA-binding GntR family transcriptional regulator
MEKEIRRTDYPTHEQMKEIWEAYKSGRPSAFADVLRKRQEEQRKITEEQVDKRDS